MITLKMARARVADQALKLFDEVVGRFPESFRRLVQPTLHFQAEILGLPADGLRTPPKRTRPYEAPEQPPEKAEIFSDGTTLFILTIQRDQRSGRPQRTHQATAPSRSGLTLTLVCVGPHLECPAFDSIVEEVNKGFSVTLERFSWISTRFDDLKAETHATPLEPSTEELTGAQALCDRATRTLAVAIKASGGLLVRDLAKQLPQEERSGVEVAQSVLIQSGIIASETVVICAKTQGQTARVPSRQVLAELAERGLRCACGRSVSDERVEEALSITDLGRRLLDKSRWLTLIVLKELHAVGVSPQRIVAEQQAGGDELDVLADISGDLVFFELKDKEFSLGSAYSFGAKIGIIRPRYPVIVTTEVVANDAKDHFQRARLASRGELIFEEEVAEAQDIRYIEGLPNISRGIRLLASEIYMGDAIRVLRRVLPLAAIDPQALLATIHSLEPVVPAREGPAPAEVKATSATSKPAKKRPPRGANSAA